METGNTIEFNISSNSDRKLLKGKVKHDDNLGFIVEVSGIIYEVRKLINIKVLSI